MLDVAVQASPVLGDIVVARLTVPKKPFRLVTDTTELAESPTFDATLAGFAVTVKSSIV